MNKLYLWALGICQVPFLLRIAEALQNMADMI